MFHRHRIDYCAFSFSSIGCYLFLIFPSYLQEIIMPLLGPWQPSWQPWQLHARLPSCVVALSAALTERMADERQPAPKLMRTRRIRCASHRRTSKKGRLRALGRKFHVEVDVVDGAQPHGEPQVGETGPGDSDEHGGVHIKGLPTTAPVLRGSVNYEKMEGTWRSPLPQATISWILHAA